MSEKQTIVTFDSGVKPPNYGPMKLHTKPLKRRETGKNVSKWEKYQFDDEYDESPLIDCRVPTKQNDMFSGVDANDVAAAMKSLSVVDGRNVLNLETWKSAGFAYRGVGRS